MIKNFIHSMIVCPDWNKQYPKITHGNGVFLYDKNDKKYLDASSGSAAVSNLGYGLEGIGEIVKEQINKISVLPTHAFSTEVVEEYMKKLIDFCPPDFERAWTSTSGTEAVENAIKLALQYQQLIGQKQRYKIISRWFSYHGNSIFTLDVGGMKYRRETYGKWMHNFPHIPPVYQYRYGKGLSEEEYCDQCINDLISSIEKNGPETIAAFIAEPIVGAALGAVAPPKRYFSEVKKICEAYGIVFIADEIMTGFGRLGNNFGIERYNTTPDIIASGKGISGGYFPLSAVIANEKISAVFESNASPFKAGHTFACNPLGAVVGSYVIDYMNKNRVVDNASKMGALLKTELNKLKEFEFVGDVRGEGLLLGIEFVQDRQSKNAFSRELNLSKLIFLEALERGLILYPGSGSQNGILGDHLLICPPLTINKNEVMEISTILQEVLKDLQSKKQI
ncbi:aminotransferase class III-fold pyridoxal phosphate-dependent enzyme [Flavobacteriaceae bacterium]|nr:aminotransferase class III-fold pyridoxal phosphate-dependent enzyme [Flavobacteriaceae bacterium]